MNSRELIRALIGGVAVPRCGFWLGNPHEETLPIYHRYFGTRTLEELHQKLGSDIRWLTPQYLATTYRHPEGKGLFDVWKQKLSLGDAGPLVNCETVEEVDRYEWPSLEYLHWDESLEQLRGTGAFYRASGFWAPFFHDVMDLFGVESFLLKMFTHPDVIHAAFRHVCEFYLEANELFFAAAGPEVDALFFGNDFGTQRDLLITPAQFEEFLEPWCRRFCDQAHAHRYQVLLHSCGSIFSVIDRLIACGVDCLHPLQAKAANMDAETLSQHFNGRIAFLGGIDTQDILVHGSPERVREEVRKVKELLGPRVIISPSHEALLSNVPPGNVAAMAEEAVR